jgi:hypothetical protein
MARCKHRVMQATMLLSHAGNGATTEDCTGCGKVVQAPEIGASRCCCIMKNWDIRIGL